MLLQPQSQKWTVQHSTVEPFESTKRASASHAADAAVDVAATAAAAVAAATAAAAAAVTAAVETAGNHVSIMPVLDTHAPRAFVLSGRPHSDPDGAFFA